jgi:hypothetical protein
MGVIKDRYQNPVIGDTVILKLFVLNSNMSAEVQTINNVKIFYLDRASVTPLNPDGRVLIQTIPGTDVTNPAQGEYNLSLYLDPLIYVNTGRYIDEWEVVFNPGDLPATLDHLFQVYPDLWFTTPIPIVYDFSFYFQPNKIRQGSKKFIEIEIIPNVPRATDLQAYYENLAISAQLFVYIEQQCGDCLPCEQDLRTVVDGQPAQYREKNRGYYFIDTENFDCGIYDMWFKLDFGGSVYVGDRNQLQIYS